MPVERINPPDVHEAPTYSHAVRVSDVTLIYIAGQVAWDQDRNVVGVGDFRAQVTQAFENLKRVLTASGADFSHVIKWTLLIVNYDVSKRAVVAEIAKQYRGDNPPPASTLIGVHSLALPELLFEIEAVAAI